MGREVGARPARGGALVVTSQSVGIAAGHRKQAGWLIMTASPKPATPTKPPHTSVSVLPVTLTPPASSVSRVPSPPTASAPHSAALLPATTVRPDSWMEALPVAPTAAAPTAIRPLFWKTAGGRGRGGVGSPGRQSRRHSCGAAHERPWVSSTAGQGHAEHQLSAPPNPA